MRVKLLLDRVKDTNIRESLLRAEDAFNSDPLGRSGFVFRTYVLTAPTYPATLHIPHQLLFVPKDVLQTSSIGAGTLAWKYDQFTQTALVATITGPVTVRLFLGTYAD